MSSAPESNSYPPLLSSAKGHENLPIISNTTIPLPPRTVGGIRDQVLKVKTCNCKKSGCLKLYCECFNAGILCNDSCCCSGCLNVESTSDRKNDKRMEMIQITLDRNQHAFRPKSSTITSSQRGKEATGKEAIGTIQPLLPEERRGKRSKLGCNCKKSFCLKKYCECFQAQLYCMASCRCENCQNIIGNEKRENLIKKLKKKEEEKESQNLAAIALAGTDHIDAGTTRDVGGVKASTVAMVSAGIAAAGVDLFLPASMYARPMIDANGKVVPEISFGVVGRQSVVEGEDDESQNLATLKSNESIHIKMQGQNKDDVNQEKDNGSMSAIGFKSGQGENQHIDLHTHRAAESKEIELYHESLSNALLHRHDAKNAQHPPSPEAALPRTAPDTSTTTNDSNEISSKRSRDQFAIETIDKIVHEIKGFKHKMTKIRAENTFHRKHPSSEAIVVDINNITDAEKLRLFCNEEIPSSKHTKQKPTDAFSTERIRSLAEQDIILYNELTRSIMERTLELTKARRESSNS